MKFLYYIFIILSINLTTTSQAQQYVIATSTSIKPTLKIQETNNKPIESALQDSEKLSTIKNIYDHTVGAAIKKTIFLINRAIGIIAIGVVMGITTIGNRYYQ